MKTYKAYTKESGLVETNDYDDFSRLPLHREDGPAFIRYDYNGSIEYVEYYINGKRHRLDGPAYIEYDCNGNVDVASYWINGKRHRLDGPAYVEYDDNGNVVNELYWINGIEYTKEQYDKELLKLKVQSL